MKTIILFLALCPIPLFGQSDSISKSFILRFSKVAQQEYVKYKIPPSISLGLALLESRSGTSNIFKLANNIFNLKCFSSKCKSGHCIPGKHKDFYRKFETCWAGYREFSKMYSRGRYSKLSAYSNDYRKFAYGLKSLGYSPDLQFAEKLIGIIEKYELFKYDK